jgi:membrane protein
MRRGAVDVIDKFLADRGTHLAAMIAYFALLAFVPLLYIALSLLSLGGEQTESSYLVEQLRRSFPERSVDELVDVVRDLQESAGTLGVIGAVALIWASLGFFSVVESALNIVYGRPNRPFVHQKLLVLGLTAAALAILFAALVVSSVGVDLLRRASIGGSILSYVYGIAISVVLTLVFTWCLYTLLTNEPLGWIETLPGALVATLVLQASFQLLPLFIRATHGFTTLQAFGGLALLLFCIYLMANVLGLGAVVIWYIGRGRHLAAEEPPAGLA